MRFSLPLSLVWATTATASTAFLQPLDASTGWIIGNSLWNITIGDVYGTKLFYGGRDLIGDAAGHYSGYDGESNFQWNNASIYQETTEFLDLVFSADLVDLHWVIFPELAGAYQYIVNKDLPTLGVLRTLFRLDNTTFTHGRTNIKDAPLPPYALYLNSTKVQDETWQQADGTFLTKYDFSAPIRDMDFHGLYGTGFGSWYIRPGRDYLNGNHLKQELTVHRESKTGDAVELNVVHGSHFMATSQAHFPAGKTWGPWLWYLNDGSKEDASQRAQQEFASWPYAWLSNSTYQSRGSVSGQLLLSNGRPAVNASVFLGDNNSNVTTLDQGTNYQYTNYTDAAGVFYFKNVRSADYALYAWGNGGALAGVSTTFTHNNVSVQKGSTTTLETLVWEINSARQPIFQIGALDRKTLGFKNAGAPYQHALVADSPANLTYTIGSSSEDDWFFGQSALGTWTVIFDTHAPPRANATTAALTLSLAGYSRAADLAISLNGRTIGSLVTADLVSDPALYRSGTTAGEWHLYEIAIDAALFNNGTNGLSFEITRSTLWRGFMWDSVLLEWGC